MADRVRENILGLADAFGIGISFKGLGTEMEDFLTKDAIAPDDVHDWALCVPIIEDDISGVNMQFGVCLYMLPKTGTEEAGLSIIPYGSAGFDEDMELRDDLVLQVKAAMDLAGGIALLIRPGKSIKLLFDIVSSVASNTTPPSSGSFANSSQDSGCGGFQNHFDWFQNW